MEEWKIVNIENKSTDTYKADEFNDFHLECKRLIKKGNGEKYKFEYYLNGDLMDSDLISDCFNS